jgi:tetratricopeptide (TPR) repeat protein
MHHRLHGDGHLETAWGLKVLANAQVEQKKFVEAEKAVREALEVFRRQFPEDHPNIRDTMYQLRTVLEARGDKRGVEALDKEEAEIAMRSGSPAYHLQLAELLTRQSITAFRADEAQRLAMDASARSEAAHREIRQAIESYGRVALEHPRDLNSRLEAISGFVKTLKVCIAAPGFADEADELNRRLETELSKLIGAFPESSDCQWRSAMRYVDWAYALEPYCAYTSLEEHAFGKEIEMLKQISISDPKRTGVWLYLTDAYDHLGERYWQSTRPEDAEAVFLRSKQIYYEHSAEIEADPTQVYGVACHYTRLAYFLACTHREREAAECLNQAALHAKRVSDPANLVYAFVSIARIRLQLGDEAGYRETCKALLDVPVTTADDLTKVRSIFTWCLAPDALENMSVVVKRAEELAAHNSLGHPHVVHFSWGAALYRAGQYERAADELEKSIAGYPREPGYHLINCQQLFLAMAKWRLGQKDEARELLAKTLPDIDKQMQPPACFWTDRVCLEVLRREAEALIEPKEKSEAPGNDKSDASRTPQPRTLNTSNKNGR